MKNRAIVAGFFFLSGMFVSSPASLAQDMPPFDSVGCHGLGEVERIRARAPLPVPPGVRLTPEQQVQWTSIGVAADKSREELWKQQRMIHERIQKALLVDGALDHDELTALEQQDEKIHAQTIRLHLQTIEKLHDLLTPPQRHTAQETMKKIRSLHEQLRLLMRHDKPEADQDEMPPPDGP